MPDNNYVWIVMEDHNQFPIGVFQKRYDLVSFMGDPGLSVPKDKITILRYRPYDHENFTVIDNNTLRAVKNG